MQPVLIYPHPRRLAIALGISVFAMVVCISAATSAEASIDRLLWGALGIPLCLLATLLLTYRLLLKRPLLAIRDDGILENSTLLSPGYLNWAEIAGADVYDHLGQRFLRIRLTDPRRIQLRLPVWQRLLIIINRAGSNVMLAVPEISLGTDVVPLAELINRHAGQGSPRKYPGAAQPDGGRPSPRKV